MDYIGEICSACGNEFTEDDDIVVCPECGSPHHRDCWQKEKHCANTAYHSSGEKWQRTVKVNSTAAFRICPVCRFPNTPDDERCRQCGMSLNEPENADPTSYRAFGGEDMLNSDYAGFDPDEDLGGATLKEVSDFVGTNTIYYIPIFKRMKDFGTKVSFNLACLAFPSLYFANRKMWGWAVVAALLSVIMSLPLVILYMADASGMPESISAAIESNKDLLSTLDGIFGIADWLIRLVFCLLGNRLYFKFVMNSLKRLRNENRASHESISTAGGIRPSNMILMVLIKGALAIGIGMLTYIIISMIMTVNDFSTLSLLIK